MTDTTPLGRANPDAVPARIEVCRRPACRLGSGRPRPTALTEQESLVLAGAAVGYSNRGIAEALHVSRKTVEAHLSSVFLKLDIRPHPERNQRVCAVLYWTTALTPPSATPGALDGPSRPSVVDRT